MNDELQFANIKLDEQSMTKAIAYLVIQVSNLQKENKVLKELNVCVGCEDNPTYKARIDKAIEKLNYYIEGMNASLKIWNKVREDEKIEDITLLQMLEREKQNYIELFDILKGGDTNENI